MNEDEDITLTRWQVFTVAVLVLGVFASALYTIPAIVRWLAQ